MTKKPKKATKPKKSNGEGTIIELPNGKFKAIVSVVVNGKRRRPSKTVDKISDAKAELHNLRSAALSNPESFAVTDRLLLKEYLDQWLKTVVKNRSESTKDLYKATCDNHIIPQIGSIPLKRLNGLAIQKWIGELQEAGIGSRTIEVAYTTLRNALNYAGENRLGLLSSNPVLKIPKPSHRRKDVLPFSLKEADSLLAAVDGTRWEALMRIFLSTGVRQGELFGLKWGKIDLKKGLMRIDVQTVEVRGRLHTDVELKTANSKRTLELTKETLASVHRHRAILLAEGNAGSVYVFPAAEGGPMSRGNFRTRFWKPLQVELGLKTRGAHHLRHTYATIAIGKNVPIPVVSRILGHAKISITMDTYGHLLEGQQNESQKVMAKLFG